MEHSDLLSPIYSIMPGIMYTFISPSQPESDSSLSSLSNGLSFVGSGS